MTWADQCWLMAEVGIGSPLVDGLGTDDGPILASGGDCGWEEGDAERAIKSSSVSDQVLHWKDLMMQVQSVPPY